MSLYLNILCAILL